MAWPYGEIMLCANMKVWKSATSASVYCRGRTSSFPSYPAVLAAKNSIRPAWYVVQCPIYSITPFYLQKLSGQSSKQKCNLFFLLYSTNGSRQATNLPAQFAAIYSEANDIIKCNELNHLVKKIIKC